MPGETQGQVNRTQLVTPPFSPCCCQQAYCLPAGLQQQLLLLLYHQHCCCESQVLPLPRQQLLLLPLLAVVWAVRGLRLKTPPRPAHYLQVHRWSCCSSAQHCCRLDRHLHTHQGSAPCPGPPVLLRPLAMRPGHCSTPRLQRQLLLLLYPQALTGAAAQHRLLRLLVEMLLAGFSLLPSRPVLVCQVAPPGLEPSASYTAGG